MKKTLLMVIALSLVVSAAAWATPRAAGMGGAQIGVADDAGAWLYNPAGLSSLDVPVQPGKVWGSDIIGGWYQRKFSGSSSSVGTLSSSSDKVTTWGVDWSAVDPAKGRGFGVGFEDTEDFGNLFGAGYGQRWNTTPWSWGVNVNRFNPDSGSAKRLFDIGFMYRMDRQVGAPVNFGLVVRDVTSEFDTMLDLGVGFMASDKLLLALDIADVFDASDNGPYVSFGAELTAGKADERKFRAGLMDNGSDRDLTLGAGYSWGDWRVDAVWVDVDSGNAYGLGVGYNF